MRRLPPAAAFLVWTALSPVLVPALPPSVDHPLDALTPQEYWAIYQTIRSAGHVHEKTLFTSVLLHEPDKATVLAFKPGKSIKPLGAGIDCPDYATFFSGYFQRRWGAI